MGERFRGLAVVVVVLVVGAFAGSALAQWWSSPVASGSATSLPVRGVPEGERVRVEVLNGGGRAGMARAATGHLRDDGFDVVFFGNGEARDSSVVFARAGDVEAARRVADALGIRTVLSEPAANLYLDVTVVLGQEWQPRPDPDGGVNSDTNPWWDLRRFLPRRPGTQPSGPGRLVDPGTGEDGR